MRLPALLMPFVLAAAALAADPSRVIKSFDFEERQAGNAEELPRDWVKIEGPGLPHYVNGRLEAGHAANGRYAFRFDLDGGSLIYRYPPGKIPVRSGATYRVAAAVRADPLPNARARITTYFADVGGRPIEGTTRHTEPLQGQGETWATLAVENTAPAEAKSLALELEFIQPAIWQATTLGKQSLFEQDIHGTARFDDVVVTQVPVIDVVCDKPGNVFARSEPMALRVSVTDRTTADLGAQLAITDAAGRGVFQRTGMLGLASVEGTLTRTGTLDLPDLPAGAYRAALAVTAGGNVLGRYTVDFIRLADDHARVRPDARFGFIATDVPIEAWPQLPALLANLGAARVKLAVWSEQNDIETAERGLFARLLDDLRQLNITPTAVLAGLPPRVAIEAGGTSLDRLPRASVETWQPQLSFMVSRYAGYLDRWQFGSDALAADFARDRKLRGAYTAVLATFDKLLDKPDLAMPWPAWFDLGDAAPPTIALSVPADVLPQQLPLYVNELRSAAGTGMARGARNVSLSLQLLQQSSYGRPAQVRDLVRRVAYALASGVERIDLPLPLTVTLRKDGTPEYQPNESLLVIRTLLSTLSGSTYQGRLPIGDDIEALLFDRQGEGIVLLWAKSDTADARPAEIVLGDQPRRVDLDGTVSPVLQPKDASGVIEVPTGPMPFFLVGVDGQLARLRTTFAFDNPMLESSFKPHVRRLRFTNPYPYGISGRVRFQAPPGWTVTPLRPEFALAAGETYDEPVTIEFPYNSVAGEKAILCDVMLQAQRTHVFKVPIPLKLGLGDIGVETMAVRDGTGIVVQQLITNYGDKPANYTAFIACPGQPRQERLLIAIRPGTTIIKKYRLTNIPPTGALRIRSGVKETDGSRILNDEIVVQ